MRRASAIGVAAAVAALALAPGAEAKPKPKPTRFQILSGTGTAKAVEDASVFPPDDSGQSGQIHAEFTTKLNVFREPGPYSSPKVSVPGKKSTRVEVKSVTTAVANGTTWIRDHFATWSCNLQGPETRAVRDYGLNGRTLQLQVEPSFYFPLDSSKCQQSEPGALPTDIRTSAGLGIAPRMLVSHTFTAGELRKKNLTVNLTQPSGAPAIDCSSGSGGCQDTASASGTLTLKRVKR